MKFNLTDTPCWVLSSHGHPCEAETSAQAAARTRRVAAARPPRRLSRRPDQLDAYWMQAHAALPEWPEAKRPAIG